MAHMYSVTFSWIKIEHANEVRAKGHRALLSADSNTTVLTATGVEVYQRQWQIRGRSELEGERSRGRGADEEEQRKIQTAQISEEAEREEDTFAADSFIENPSQRECRQECTRSEEKDQKLTGTLTATDLFLCCTASMYLLWRSVETPHVFVCIRETKTDNIYVRSGWAMRCSGTSCAQ